MYRVAFLFSLFIHKIELPFPPSPPKFKAKKMEFPSKFRKLGILNSNHLFILSYKVVILEIQYPP